MPYNQPHDILALESLQYYPTYTVIDGPGSLETDVSI